MSSLASNWFAHVLQALWQNTAVALLVLVLVSLMRRASPQLRHALVFLALLKFALPPMLPLPTGLFSAAPPAPSIEPVRGLVVAATQPPVAPALTALMALHIVGIALALSRLALHSARLRGIRRRATMKEGVLVSREIRVPMTAGVLRPFILLPESLLGVLSATEVADVLAHEREHVRRRDVLLNWLQEIVLAVWWFHPLAARLGREARALREECCDDAVLARGTCESAHYARTLLRAATFATSPPLAAAAIAESEPALLHRVRRIADERFVPAPRLSASALAFVAVLALLLLPGLRVSPENRFAFDRETRAALIGHSHRH
jgi:beta-lactamase regulating signal transducer with metallopeptidase domain